LRVGIEGERERSTWLRIRWRMSSPSEVKSSALAIVKCFESKRRRGAEREFGDRLDAVGLFRIGRGENFDGLAIDRETFAL
jgi:hypothetical protein